MSQLRLMDTFAYVSEDVIKITPRYKTVNMTLTNKMNYYD